MTDETRIDVCVKCAWEGTADEKNRSRPVPNWPGAVYRSCPVCDGIDFERKE